MIQDQAPQHVEWIAQELSTGVRLNVAVQGDPGGPALILLHGYSDSSFSFSSVLPLLPERYRVIVPDQRGHGDSARPEAGYTMRDLAADVVALMDALEVERAVVVGHSMGTFVAQQVALVAPERVAGIVLIDGATSIRRINGFEELRTAVEALEDPVPEAFAREFQESTVYRPLPTAFMDRAVQESLKLSARVWQAVMTGMIATAPAAELGGTGIPVLLLWGERDAVFPRSEQDGLLELVPGAELKVYPETGHALHWERPQRFVRDLLEFAERVVTAAPAAVAGTAGARSARP